MDAVLAAVAAAALNHHRNNNPIVRDDDDDLDLGADHVARRLRACSAAYMALGASLLIIAGGDDDNDRDHVVVGFLLWMAGTVLLLLSSVATRFPAVAAVAAGVAQTAVEELALAAALAVVTGRRPGLLLDL